MTRHATARLFVAVDLPDDVRGGLEGWTRSALRQASGHASVRVLDASLLHVTLCFLGSRPVGEIDVIASRLVACGGRAGELSLGAPLWLPTRRPRALAVEIHDDGGELADLQRAVVAAVGEASDWEMDGDPDARSQAHRPFHPHVTVARLSRGATHRRSELSPLGRRELAPTPSLSFVPSELVLYRSWLSPEGASYEAIASYAIG